MYFSDAKLPVSLDPYTDESGLGYCLRSMSRNGSNLTALRRLLNIKMTAPITKEHAAPLSYLFQTSESWLAHALPGKLNSKHAYRDYRGHQFLAPNHLRINNPQVCATCIRVNGYCKAQWDLSLAMVCLEHRCFLTDQCQICSRKFRWERPSVDIAFCGHYIQSPASRVISNDILDFQNFVYQKFNDGGAAIATNLPEWVHGVSLSGLLLFVCAFGMVKGSSQTKGTSLILRNLSAYAWEPIVSRAIERISRFAHAGVDCHAFNAVVDGAILERIIERSSHEMDVQLALDCHRRIFGENPKNSMRGRHPLFSQRSLF